jgi:AcrR family transcriptional regulator
VAAATACMTEHGFHASTMCKIARRAGMSVGAIYQVFENKEAIVEAIVRRDLAQVSALTAALENCPDAAHALSLFVSQALEQIVGTTAGLRAEIMAEAARSARGCSH